MVQKNGTRFQWFQWSDFQLCLIGTVKSVTFCTNDTHTPFSRVIFPVLLDCLCHNKHTIVMNTNEVNKPVVWLGNSLDELKKFPDEVQDEMGYALYQAQINKKHPNAKPLKGFKGAGVLEIVDNFDGDTYRTVYTVLIPGS